MTPPVLFLLFNRPDLAEHVFARIREAEPPQLFIAVDGPRRDRNDESELVAQNQAFAGLVDWDCEVKTLFRDENLGCGRAVSEAITWFFEHVEAGIILEDDCVPDLSFFRFAGEMLTRYATDERVMMVNGTSYQSEEGESGDSYYFSMFDMVWGWASWRRAWECYDFSLSKFPGDAGVRESTAPLGWLTRLHINRIWRRIKAGKVDTWDYQWEHTIWSSRGLVVTPYRNLVTNIGFDERATHTSTGDDGRAERESTSLSFPLTHPQKVERDLERDKVYEKERIMSFPIFIRLLSGRVRGFLKL